MNLRTLIPLALIFVLGLSACGNGATSTVASPTSEPTATPAPDDVGFNLLIVADGEVELERGEWSGSHLTAFGAALYSGDLVKPANGTRAVILCDDLAAWAVPAGMLASLATGCPPSPEPLLKRGDNDIINTRGGSDPFIPYIISPRKTKLLDANPTLRWNPVPGATRYTVSVEGGQEDWTFETDQTELVYPSDAPPLEPGVDYLLIIKTDNGKSSQSEGLAGLGFSLLAQEDAQHARDAAAQLAELNLPDEARAFALAQVYAGYGLIAEAIETLEALLETGSQTAAVYRALGDFYRQTELSLLAQARYLDAIELAAAAGDVEGQAAAQVGLGEVYATLGQHDLADEQLRQARDGYEALGDVQRVSELDENLK